MASVGALVLFPGAGSSRDHSSLLAIEASVAPLPVDRVDFPYRIAGRKAPDRPAVLLASVRDAAAAMAKRARVRPARVVLGGRSMGGRMGAMAVAGTPDLDGAPPLAARALVLISYPLHPPGKPDTLRVEHFSRLHVPCLFVHGTRDPFGSPAELERWTATIPAGATHVWIEGGRHDLSGADADIAAAVHDWFGTLR